MRRVAHILARGGHAVHSHLFMLYCYPTPGPLQAPMGLSPTGSVGIQVRRSVSVLVAEAWGSRPAGAVREGSLVRGAGETETPRTEGPAGARARGPERGCTRAAWGGGRTGDEVAESTGPPGTLCRGA